MERETEDSIGRAGLVLASCALALLGLLLAAGPADATIRAAATNYGKAEQVKTIPISRQAWQDPRSAMSLPPEKVGELVAGDRIEAAGDFEVTTCLKPDPRHPGDGQPCIGDLYGYSPTIAAQIVIAPGATATDPSQVLPISKTFRLDCRQDHPVRNHHCVISIPFGGINIDDPAQLPCEVGACHINMLVSAYSPEAGGGELVVLGSSDDKKRINQGLAQLNSIRYRPGDTKPSKSWRGGSSVSKLPIGAEDHKVKRKAIYSAKISNLKAGDQLVVEAKARTSIGHLPYNVFQRTEVVLAKSKKSTKPSGKGLDSTARVTSSSGFNCTQQKSAHSDVCEIAKSGVVSVKKNIKGPVYVNIVAGQVAVGIDKVTKKWRRGDNSKVQNSGGYVSVKRYSGSGSCDTCATGPVEWGPGEPEPSGKAAILIRQLAEFRITSGTYNCAGRPDGSYVCKWSSQGRFGSSPPYKCDTRATLPKGGDRFKLKVCKEALGSDLWDQLTRVTDPAVEPTFAGSCKELDDGDFRCNWFGDAASGPNEGKGCKGSAVYRLPEHRWDIDPCRP